MAKGYFALVLHAHLPFVRHPEDPTVMEEQWLYEGITGTYLPLIQMFEGLVADGVQYRCTVSLSAPLMTMLTDDLLKERYARYLDRLIELAEKELDRTRHEPHYQRLAQMYFDRFQSIRHTWRCHEGDLVRAFRRLMDAGRIEVITSTATHAFFPLLDRNWAALRAQVHVAADLYERHFGRRSLGMWLGECGYVPGVDELLREAAIRYFFVDTHALLYADKRPAYGSYAPLYCPTGVAAFGRDTESSQQVWSAKEGYPGDPHYRDFYRDIGFDLPMEYIGPYVHPEGHRIYTGIKYQAITHNQLHDKWVYNPDIAQQKAADHATDFRINRQKQAEHLSHHMDRPPIIVSPYDAELYGHWWYEGPQFLSYLFRQLHHNQSDIETITPGDYLERHPTNQLATPCASSWGQEGYGSYWCDESNAWTYRHLHVAAERMVELARTHRSADALTERALNQAARELMLAQSSDWPFIMKTGTTVPYATRRFNEHIIRFNRLYDELRAGRVTESWLSDVESKDNIFPNLGYQIYAT
jgi:1,4-alpha-glucan branching enzyme